MAEPMSVNAGIRSSIFTRDLIDNENVHVGDYTYGLPRIYMWTRNHHVYIGKFCSIAENVSIMVDGNHRTDWVSTYPFHVIEGVPMIEGHPVGKGDIVIGNDVWLGMNATIMPGVKIGDGAVIGASSVVTRNVDDYEIVGGNPARHIKYRFREGQIRALRGIKWWDWDIDQIRANVPRLVSGDVDDFIRQFSPAKQGLIGRAIDYIRSITG